MSKKRDNRVLGRMGARELTLEEIQEIVGSGSGRNTHASLIVTGTPSNPDEYFDQ